MVNEFIDDSREPQAVRDEARRMVLGTFEDLTACDELVTRHARQWSAERLAMVDRNILRLATWEIRTGRAPVKVVISEALRLASEFSTAQSPRFVNGVLDAVARDRSTRAAGTPDNE